MKLQLTPCILLGYAQKKLSLTAAIYYYYYLLHHILLQLYYKFPLKSNHILKLFTAKLETGLRQKVHVPAWAWTFLQFRFVQTQHLTLLLLKDGSNCRVWMSRTTATNVCWDTWEVSGVVAAETGFHLLVCQAEKQRDEEWNCAPICVNSKTCTDFSRARISLQLKRWVTDRQILIN